MARTGHRLTGAAAVAVGLWLAGAQGVAVADSDTRPPEDSNATAQQTGRAAVGTHRVGGIAPGSRTRSTPPPAAASESELAAGRGAGPRSGQGPGSRGRGARAHSEPSMRFPRPARLTAPPDRGSPTRLEVSLPPDRFTVGIASAATEAAAAPRPPSGEVAVPVSPFALAAPPSALSAPPAAAPPAGVAAHVATALSRDIVDGFAPGGPLADFLQGALLLVQRSVVAARPLRAPACVSSGDCSGENLARRNLSGLDLTGVDFTNANLSRANLSGTNLTSALILDANLYRADLSNAILTGQDLSGKDLRYDNFSGADLSGAILRGTQFQSANLTNAVLVGADLSGAQFWCAGGGFACRGTPLSARYTYGANLNGADFTGANLTRADLTGAFLSGAVFTNANLTAVSGKCSEQGPGRSCSGGLQQDASAVTLTGANLTGVVDLAGRDLHGKDLSGAILTGTNLRGTNLAGTNLQGVTGLALATLTNARLTGVNLTGVDLTGVTGLLGRDLTGAVLSRANLTGVSLDNAILVDAVLTGSIIDGTTLVNADLSGADLSGLDLSRAVLRPYPAAEIRLSGADLTGANLYSTPLDGADLSYATLVGATLPSYLQGVDLYGAELTGLNLTGANLTGADLTRADLTAANLTDADLTDAVLRGTVVARAVWNNTTCSDGSKSSTGCTISPAQSYLALQGGGFKALTVDAAVIAGALHYLKQQGATTPDGTPVTSLVELFSEVKTISANSGGSWFTSFLAYSPEFAAQLENPDTFFAVDGYMGLAKAAYNNYLGSANIGSQAEFNALLGSLFTVAGSAVGYLIGGPAASAMGAFFGRLVTIPVAAALYQVPLIRQAVTMFGKSQQGDLSWQKAMDEMVFAPMGLRDLQNRSFSDGTGRTDALRNVNLVYSAALGTGGAVVTHEEGLGFLLQGANAGFSVNQGNDKYLPVLLSSMTNGAVAPPTLPTVNGALRGYFETPGQVHIGNFNYARRDVTIDPFTFDGSVWTATNASSAALGMLGNWSAMTGTPIPGLLGLAEAGIKLTAAPVLLTAAIVLAPFTLFASIPLANALLVMPWTPIVRNIVAWQFRDMAVPFQLDQGSHTITSPRNWKIDGATSVERLANNPILRLSDGGYTDDTSIAAQLKTMQVNGDLTNGFEITYISDTSSGHLRSLNGASLDTAFVDLFGNRGTLTTPGSELGLSTPHDSPNLFSTNQIGGLNPLWSYTASAVGGARPTEITYREITVTTDAGNIYGLPAGVRGRINVIQVVNNETSSLPIEKGQSGDTGFGEYRRLFDAVLEGMAAGGGAYVGDAIAGATVLGAA